MNRLVAFGLVVAMGCGPRHESGVGRPASGVRRVVSLVPSVTEIIFALGAESVLVGTTNQCDFPAAARRIYKVGDFAAPDIERIGALRPDLVFVTLPIHKPVAERLREMGVRVYESEPRDLEGIFAEVREVGEILGRGAEAKELVDQLRAGLDSLPVDGNRPGVYVEISSAPLMTVGGRSFVDGLIERAGGRNVFHGAAVEYPVVDPEMVVTANPDVIVILHPGVKASEVGRRLGWDGVNAVRMGRVYDDLDPDLLLRPGPRIVEGVRRLAERIHSRIGDGG